MQISKLYGLQINVFSKTLLGVILLTLSACSPYLYTNEISLFNEGIDNSFASFEEIKNEARERRIEIQNEQLKKDSRTIKLTEGCLNLQTKYLKGFQTEARNVLTEADYQKCQIDPLGDPTLDPFLPNLTAIGVALQNYGQALVAVSKAEDVTNLQNAFTEFNTNIKDLLKEVNQKLSERGEEQFDAIADLVYRTGIIYLNQRRFDALKKAVNETHPVIKKASELLAEAAFDMYTPKLNGQLNELDRLKIDALRKSGDDYVAAWLSLKSGRDTYVELLKNSPMGDFQLLVDTHAALRESVNDPSNEDQIIHVLTTAKEFHDSAKATLDLLKKNEQNENGMKNGS